MTFDAAHEHAASEHRPETMNMPAAPPAALLLLPLVAARLTASEEVTPPEIKALKLLETKVCFLIGLYMP